MRLYFDYAAGTPVDRRVLAAMRPYFGRKFGNPGSLHSFGQEAMAAVDGAREKIAKTIGAEFREVIFTGSATEANNLALRGTIKSFKLQASSFKSRVVVSAIEHESVLETARDLEKEGVDVVYLPVSREGIVDLEKLKSALDERTVLVSVMYANNEIGTIQPIAEISKIISEFKEKICFSSTRFARSSGELARPRRLAPRQKPGGPSQAGCGVSEKTNFFFNHPLFHTDATQAFQFLDCDASKLGVDLMTLSAHKIYGPKGIGALFMKHETLNMKQKSMIQDSPPEAPARPSGGDPPSAGSLRFQGAITGGGQEFGLRSGTENVASIVGFAKAAELAARTRERESKRIKELKKYFWSGVKKMLPSAEINGCPPENRNCLPSVLSVYFPGRQAQDLLAKFDLARIAVSAGSACRARSTAPSAVILALGCPKERAEGSLRFSFGRQTTKGEVDKALGRIRKLFKNNQQHYKIGPNPLP